MNTEDLKKLAEPFPASDIEWRVGQAGQNGERVWAKVLAYVTNRAIMDRLDGVCGPENWANQFTAGPSGGVLCGISIMVDGYWVTKWDGAENTDFEAVKGGLSGAMKRAAVHWGIGRYLYGLEAGWADINDNGAHYQPKDKQGKYPAFKWDAPGLPAWAVPEGDSGTHRAQPEPGPKSEPAPKKSVPKATALKDFFTAWQAVVDDIPGGSDADKKRTLEHYFLWKKTCDVAMQAFDPAHDYMRDLGSAKVVELTTTLHDSRSQIVAWFGTPAVKAAVGLEGKI